MDVATILNMMGLALGALVLFILRNIGASLKDLREKDEKLQQEINEQAVTVATNYISKSDFKTFSDAIFTKLDRIESKIDTKQDKQP